MVKNTPSLNSDQVDVFCMYSYYNGPTGVWADDGLVSGVLRYY